MKESKSSSTKLWNSLSMLVSQTKNKFKTKNSFRKKLFPFYFHDKILKQMCNFAEPVSGQYRVSEAEAGFARSVLLLLLRALASTLEKQPRPAARTPWQGAVWAAKDSVRILAGQLLAFLLSPRQPPRVRMFVVHTLHGEPKCRELLSSMLQANAQVTMHA